MSSAFWLTALFFLTILWNGLGTTIGYHRLLAHRSFTCAKSVEYFFVMGAIFGFQGSPIWWTTIHRSHHRHSDTILDSHSPRHGFQFWDYNWFLKPTYSDHMNPKLQCPDLMKNKFYSFLDQDGDWVKAQWLNFFGIAVLGRLILVPFVGWQGALVSLVASLAYFQMPILLNYICHIPIMGVRPYNTVDDSVNVWWMGIFWFGEGWHNNHHAFPTAARAGIKSHEFDLSWCILKLLKKCGLVYRLNDITPELLVKLDKRFKPKIVYPGSSAA